VNDTGNGNGNRNAQVVRVFVIVIVSVLVFAPACRPQKATPDSGFDGAALYATACVKCHGPSGHADTPEGRAAGARDLTRDEARRMSDAEIAHQITVGRGKMPAFGGALSEGEVEALVQYVRKLQGGAR
jgi:mono/diheme cytochrome c family protein